MRYRVPLAAVAVAAAAALFPPTQAGAYFGCPSDMSHTPSFFVNNGDKKDKDPRDGLVCAKPAPECAVTMTCPGGPDRQMELEQQNLLYGVPLLGADGDWYWVTDNSY